MKQSLDYSWTVILTSVDLHTVESPTVNITPTMYETVPSLQLNSNLDFCWFTLHDTSVPFQFYLAYKFPRWWLLSTSKLNIGEVIWQILSFMPDITMQGFHIIFWQTVKIHKNKLLGIFKIYSSWASFIIERTTK